MSTIQTIKAADVPPESLVRHLGLYCRDLYELNGDEGPHQIRDKRTTVRWDPDTDAAVFDLDGIALTVPSAALDDITHLEVAA